MHRTPAVGLAGLLLASAACPAQAQGTTPGEAAQTGARATPAVTAYPAEAAGDGAVTAGYAISRWAEDWRRYADPARRDDPIDRLKFIALDSDGDVYATVSGELRTRVNVFTNPGLREKPHSREDLLRLFAGADLHLGSHLRVYGEVAHGGESGRNIGTPAATQSNDLIVQQAFVEGNVTIAGAAIGGRYGRQEFADGSTLLVSQRDNPNIRTVLQGARGWARGSRVRVDIFDLVYLAYGARGTGDDRADHNRRFSGITGGVAVPRDWLGGSKLYLDPFFWRLRTRTMSWGPATGREERDYQGLRLWGDVGRLTIDWTADHQGGRFAGRPIDAWQVFAAQTVRLGAKATAPRIGFHADYASGGGAYGTGTLRTAESPYVNAIYHSYQTLLGPANLAVVAPNVTVSPLPRVRITAEYEFAWRPVENDAVYRANGVPFAGTQIVRGHRVAELARIQAVWALAPRVVLSGRYEHLAAGPVLTRAGYASSDHLAGWLTVRF